MRGIASATDEAGDAAATSGVEFGSFGAALDAVDDDAMEMAVSGRTAASAIDEVGDEAAESAAELQAYSASAGTAAAASGGLGAEIGPVHGSFSTLAAAAAAATPPLISLTGALGGAATAAGAAGAGFAALFAGGLMKQAEDMAAASSEIENTGEAIEEIFGNIQSAVSQALEPLKTVENVEFAMAGLEGMVELVAIAADGFAQMQTTLRPIASLLGSAVLETAPAIFDEMDQTIQDLEGGLRGLAGVIRDIPALIAWLRQQAAQVGDELWAFGGSAISASAALGGLGSTVLELVLPVLSVALDMIGWVAQALDAIPKPVLAAAAAFGIYTAIVATYGGVSAAAAAATWGLVGAVATLTAPISATVLAVGALIGALVGAITYLGLWDDIIGAVTGTWNALIESIEYVIEVTYGMITAVESLFGPLLLIMGGPLATMIWVIGNLGEIIQFVGGLFQWLAGLAYDIGSAIMDVIGTIVSGFQEVISWAMDVANAIPGVSVDFGDIQKTVELDAIKAGDDSSSGDDPPERKEEGRTKEEAQNHFDFRGADFGGASSSEIERTVQEAVREANRESRSREDASTF